MMTILALLLAVLFDWLLSLLVPSGRFNANGMWYDIMTGNSRPLACTDVMVSVELKNGSSVEGSLKGYDLDADQALRYLVVNDHPALRLRLRAPNGDATAIPEQWGYVVIPESEIRLVTMGYSAMEDAAD